MHIQLTLCVDAFSHWSTCESSTDERRQTLAKGCSKKSC